MGAHPKTGTGYARMTNKITNYLANIPGVEVVCYAFDYNKKGEIADRFVDPRIKIYDCFQISKNTDPFAINYAASYIVKENPDVLFIYNNTVLTRLIMEAIPESLLPPMKYLYLDILYEWQDIMTYNYLKRCKFDKIFVFSDHWKNHLVNDLGFSALRISTLTQVIDFENLVETPQDVAKKELNLKPSDYLIVNMNRNVRRKGWPATISGFLEFLKRQNMNPSIKLLCGCHASNIRTGYDIQLLVRNECERLKLDVQKVLQNNMILFENPMIYTDSHIWMTYSAADLGINTAHGEGFGLTTMEHLMFNRPQIVSGIPALKDSIGNYASVIEPDTYLYDPPNENTGGFYGCIDYMKVADCIEYHYKNRDVLPNPPEDLKVKHSVESMVKVLDKYFNNQV